MTRSTGMRRWTTSATRRLSQRNGRGDWRRGLLLDAGACDGGLHCRAGFYRDSAFVAVQELRVGESKKAYAPA